MSRKTPFALGTNNILLNGLSAGGGGGLAVATQLAKALADARPNWRVTTLLRSGFPLHEEARNHSLSANQELWYSEHSTNSVFRRRRYEKKYLPSEIVSRKENLCINLNAMLLGKQPVPIVCHFQDPWAYRPQAWFRKTDFLRAMLKRNEHRKSIRQASHCTWTSEYLRGLITTHLGEDRSLGSIVYNGVPDQWLLNSNVTPVKQREDVVVTLGNVSQYKRQSLVVQSVAELVHRRQMTSIRYLILGSVSDSYRHELQKLINSLNVSENVRIEGRVPETRIRSVLSSSRCKILMSVCESFGIPCVEAMSLGCPVIVSDQCALPEICGRAAITVSADEPMELASQIYRVLTDDSIAEDLQQRGLRRCQEMRWSAAGERMAKVCEQILLK